MVLKSPRKVWKAISAMAPATSTPVAPPPTTTKVSRALRRSGSVSHSARSKAIRIRCRISRASPMLFRGSACFAHWSLPNQEALAPTASTSRS